MRDGCGSLNAFVHLGGEDEKLAETAAAGLQLSVLSGAGDGRRLQGSAPILLPASHVTGGFAAGEAMHAEVLADWQKLLVDEVVEELSGLASAGGGDASARALATRLHLGFLLQRVKALEVHVK